MGISWKRALCLAALLAGLTCSPAAAQELDCLIQPKVTVTLSFPLEGLIETVRVDRGDVVKKGQIVATMESDVEKASVAIARANAEGNAAIDISQTRLELGVRKLNQNSKLFKNRVISSQDLDEIKTTKELAELDLRKALEEKRIARLQLKREIANLNLRTLRSPVNGVVVERIRSPGEFSKQEPVLKLAQIDPLYVEVFAPIDMLEKIRLGGRAQVFPEQPVGGSYTAKVTVVDPVVDASSGTFGVRLELPNPGNRLPAGLKCKVRF